MARFTEFLLINQIEEFLAEDAATLAKNRFIDPETGSKWRLNRKADQLKAVIDHEVEVNGTNREDIWVNFSSVSKFGQRISLDSGKTTPAGIFGYPADYFLSHPDASFSDRAYMHVFKVKDSLETGFDHENDGDEFQDILNRRGDEVSKNLFQHYMKVAEEPRLRHLVDLLQKIYKDVKSFSPDQFHKLHWLSDPDAFINETVIRGKELFEHLEETIKQFTLDGTTRAFSDVELSQNKLWAKPTPEFARFFKDRPRTLPYHIQDLPQRIIDAIAGGEKLDLLDIQQITKIPYEHVLRFENSMQLNNPQNAAIVKNFIKELNDIILHFQEKGKDDGIPNADKLKSYADQHGVSYEKAIRDLQGPTIRTPNQFLYRMLQQFAHQKMMNIHKFYYSSDKYHAVWSKMMRDFGYSGAADTKDSGFIHSGEPTQGVFFDPRKITHITTIIQKSHASGNDPASRPVAKSWDAFSATKQHTRTSDPQDQRVGSNYRSHSFSNTLNAGFAIAHRLGELRYSYLTNQSAAKAIKLLKYYNNIKKLDPNLQDLDVDVRASVNDFLKGHTQDVNPQYVQYIKSLLDGQNVPIPIISRPKGVPDGTL